MATFGLLLIILRLGPQRSNTVHSAAVAAYIGAELAGAALAVAVVAGLYPVSSKETS